MMERNFEVERLTPTALIVVAHPDDETLFAGGTIFLHPDWNWHVVTLCRGSDSDRRPRFHYAMSRFGVRTSSMGDSDDGPDQNPLQSSNVERDIFALLPKHDFDKIITHSLSGEYTRHLRHEEVSRALVSLWKNGDVTCRQLWMFAYEDSGQGTYPVARPDAHFIVPLPAIALEAKRAVLAGEYNFGPNSWESLSMPTREAFWCFDDAESVDNWRRQQILESRANTSVDWGDF